jgi:RHS repeat-associated protein
MFRGTSCKLRIKRRSVEPGNLNVDLQYTYSPTQNNGQITQFKDAVSGEQVTYAYDSLNRLISATTASGAWGQSFGYDGFGNLLQKTVIQGSAPALSVVVDPATNHIVGQSYDANGNIVSVAYYGSYYYDSLNRLVQVGPPGTNNSESYAYGPDNERVYKSVTSASGGSSTQYNYLYGPDGCKVGVYQPATDGSGHLYFTGGVTPCFAGRVLSANNNALAIPDRLGSLRQLNSNQTGTTGYYPYGEEQQPTAGDTEKFGTYYRDNTGLDYARNRYYSSQFGRFLTADPSGAYGADPGDPGTWKHVCLHGR